MKHSSRCRFCAGLTIEALVEFAKKELRGNLFPNKHYYPHHASFGDLEAAAVAGCDVCKLILDCFKGTILDGAGDSLRWPDRWESSPSQDEITMYEEAMDIERSKIKLSINSQSSTLLWFHVGPVYERTPSDNEDEADKEIDSSSSLTSDPALDDLKLLLTVAGGPLQKVAGHPIGRVEVDPDLGSPSHHALVRRWFHDYEANHPNCWPNEVPELPTRVIDVGLGLDHVGQAPDTICVVELPGVREKYAALSHCWGGQIEPGLEMSKLAEFKVSVPYSALAANFRDAITITRNLGLRYLWIDSLCIIQDSVADWEGESQRMGAIYRNAAVTIYATASRGSKDGILNKRTVVPEPAAVKLKLFSDPCDETTITVSKRAESLDESLWHLSWGSPLSKLDGASRKMCCLRDTLLTVLKESTGSALMVFRPRTVPRPGASISILKD